MSTHYLPYTHTYTHNTQWGGTALRAAIEKEHEDIVELLLEANADPNLPGKVILTYHTCIAVVRHDLDPLYTSHLTIFMMSGCSLFPHQDRPLPC